MFSTYAMYECMKEFPSCSILKRGRIESETERRVPFDAVRLGNSFVTLLPLSLSPSSDKKRLN